MNCCPMFGMSSELLETIKKELKRGLNHFFLSLKNGVFDCFFIQKIGLNSGRTMGEAVKKP